MVDLDQLTFCILVISDGDIYIKAKAIVVGPGMSHENDL